MSNRNPATILYDGYGNPIAVVEDDFIFNNQPGLLFAGKDENGLVKFISVSSAGAIKTAPVGERIVDGEYYFGSGLITGAAAPQNLVTLENPTASGKTIYLNRIIVNGTIADKFSTPFVYRLSRTTALPTGGTTQTIQKRDSTDTAAVGVIRTAPTVTAAAGSIWTGSPGLADKLTYFQSLTDPVATFEEKKEIVIAPGEAIVIIAEANAIVWSHWVNIHWNEVSI